MCRLFALHAGNRDVAADFWLLDAPDSIARQSEVNADGYGLAALTARRGMILMRNPVEAAGDSILMIAGVVGLVLGLLQKSLEGRGPRGR